MTSLLQIYQKLPCFLFSDRIADKVSEMHYLFITVVECQLDNFDIAVSAALAFHEKSVLRCEPASQHVVDLAGHTPEPFGQILSSERYLAIFVFIKKLSNVFLYDLC